MTTAGQSSGTYGFALSNGEIVFEAFDRCGIRPAAVDRHMLLSARTSMNLELLDWSNRGGPNLWEIVSGTIDIASGTQTYTLPTNVVTVTEVYLSQVNANGAGVNSDRIMTPLTRTQWAMLPNKAQLGTPTQFWYEMLATPQINFWANPNVSYPTYVVNYFALQRIQDANIAGGETPDVVYRGLEALCSGLAVRLWGKFGPKDNPAMWGALREALKEEAKTAWDNFASRDQEMGPQLIQPNVGVYGKIW